MDILRCRGKRGYEAFLEALEFYYPEHFTLLTGREPAQRCSMILGEWLSCRTDGETEVQNVSGCCPGVGVRSLRRQRVGLAFWLA